MAWRPHGRARVDARRPESFAVCDRCGFWYNHSDLTYQSQWSGTRLQNLYLLVCRRTCLDIPQEQLRTVVLPPDPTPTYFARPESFYIDDTTLVSTQQQINIITQSGGNIITQGGNNITGAQNSTVSQLINQLPLQQPV